MARKRTTPLLPPTVFLTLEELAARWRRAPRTAEQMALTFGIPVHRLTARGFLYALKDVEAVEEASRHRGPSKAPHTAFKSREQVRK